MIEHADTSFQLWPFQHRRLSSGMGLSGNLKREAEDLIRNLLAFVAKNDVMMLEINPLAVTEDGHLLVLDAKMHFDDSALRRHPDVAAMRDSEDLDVLERMAQENGVNYVRLQGTVGTVVNGAGLAMATMDVIKQAGAEPANFLDVGGGANDKAVAAGVSVILADPHACCILVNIFGGIVRCDVVARGITDAVKSSGRSLPLVIRLEGTNVREGWRIINESGIVFERADSIAEAARKVEELAGRV
jgi:succinyl-CoA synthetase beta subunit